MKVRRSSWHFRMYRLLLSCWSEGPDVFKGRRTDHVPRDLCHYFWTIFLMTIAAPAWVAVVIAGGIIYGFAVVMVLLYEAGPRRLFRKISKWDEARHEEWLKEKRSKPPKQPNMLVTFMKARKQKLCPVIEVVDDAGNNELA